MPGQNKIPKIRIELKFHICVDDKRTECGYVFFSQSGSKSSIGISARLIESLGEHHVVLKDRLSAAIGINDIGLLHITEIPLIESGLPLIAHGPCLYLSFIYNITDADTGKQLWPK